MVLAISHFQAPEFIYVENQRIVAKMDPSPFSLDWDIKVSLLVGFSGALSVYFRILARLSSITWYVRYAR